VKPANPAKDKVRAMRELLLSDEYAEQKRAVNRFMLVLTTLYSWITKHLLRPPSLCTGARAFTLRKMRGRC
jgi:negative regulator of replication initiation